MRRSVSRAAFWAALETGGAQAAAFLFFVVFARLLSPREFGVYALAMAIVGFVNMILFQGFGDGLIQAERLDDDAVDTAFWTNMALGVAMVVALQLFALAAPTLFHNAELGPVVSWLSLLCLPRALVSIHSALFRRSLDLRVFALRTLIGSVAGGAVGVVLALLGYGVWALVIAQFVQSILVAAIMWNATPWRPRLVFSAAAFHRLLAFSRNFMAASLISSCIDDFGSLVVGLTMDFTAVGYFSVALRVLRAVIILVMTPLQLVMMPALSRIAHDKPRFGAGYSNMVILISTVWLPMVAGLGLAAPILIPLVFGPQWAGAIPVVTAMSFVALTMPLWTFSGQAMTALGRPDAFAGMAYWQLGLYAVAFVLAVPFGIVAVGWTWAGLSAAMVPVSLARLRRLADLDVGSLLRRSARVAVAGAAMVATGLLVRRALPHSMWSLPPMGLAALAAYAAALVVILPGHITHLAQSAREALPRRRTRRTAA